MNESQILLAIVTGLFAGGGVLGAKGLLDRYINRRQEAGIAVEQAEQGRQTTMAEATVQMAQRLSEAMIELARETLRTSNTNILQLASGLETHRTESNYHVQALKDCFAQNEQQLARLATEVHSVNQRLGVIVDHLSKNGAKKA